MGAAAPTCASVQKCFACWSVSRPGGSRAAFRFGNRRVPRRRRARCGKGSDQTSIGTGNWTRRSIKSVESWPNRSNSTENVYERNVAISSCRSAGGVVGVAQIYRFKYSNSNEHLAEAKPYLTSVQLLHGHTKLQSIVRYLGNCKCLYKEEFHTGDEWSPPIREVTIWASYKCHSVKGSMSALLSPSGVTVLCW